MSGIDFCFAWIACCLANAWIFCPSFRLAMRRQCTPTHGVQQYEKLGIPALSALHLL